jgi:hypothetical protein
MRRVRTPAKYEELEAAVAKALVQEVRAVLQQAGLKGAVLKATVASVASSAAGIIDGSTYVEVENDYLVPILGFAMGRMRNQLLIPEEGGSSVHEFVPGVVAREFKSR